MNWGYKILTAFILFALFLGVLVFRSYQAEVNLVAPDYYRQELAFQDEIDKMQNEQSLAESARIELDREHGQILINFPEGQVINRGTIVLYRPSDKALDRSWNLELDGENRHILTTTDLMQGLWKIKLEWSDNAKTYLKEQNIFLP